MALESSARYASIFVRTHRERLAAEIAGRVTAHFGGDAVCGTPASEKSVRDVGYHLMYLAEALWAGDPALLVNYVTWAKVLFAGLHFDDQVLPVTLSLTQTVLQEQLPSELIETTADYLMVALAHADTADGAEPTYLDPEAPHTMLAHTYLKLLLHGERQRASQLILNAVANGVSIKEIYLHVFQRTQQEIGRLWQMNEVTVAQEHYCTAATQLIMSQLYPNIFNTERVGKRLVATSVGGELHEIGIRMVTDFFELEGWDTYYLGANMPAAGVADAVTAHAADVLAISVTLTPHMGKAVEMIEVVRRQQRSTRIMVGGYPFNIAHNLWREVGADGYAADAAAAVALGNQLTG